MGRSLSVDGKGNFENQKTLRGGGRASLTSWSFGIFRHRSPVTGVASQKMYCATLQLCQKVEYTYVFCMCVCAGWLANSMLFRLMDLGVGFCHDCATGVLLLS